MSLGGVIVVTLLLGLSIRRWPTMVRALTFAVGSLAVAAVPLLDPMLLRGPGASEMAALDRTVGLPWVAGLWPSTLALVAMPAVIAAVAIASIRGERRMGWALFAIAIAFVVIVSGSRSASIAVVGGAAAVVLLGTRGTRTRAAGLALAGVALAVLVALVSFDDRALVCRMRIWTLTLGVIAESPLAWPGYGSFPYLVDAYDPASCHTPGISSVHSWPLQTIVDFGPLGAGALVATALTAVRTAASLRARGRDSEMVARVFYGCLTGLLLAGTTESVMTGVITTGSLAATYVSPVPFCVLALPLFERARLGQGSGRGRPRGPAAH